MLDVQHDGQTVVFTWVGALDEDAASGILAALITSQAWPNVVVDLTRATTICDSALARLAQSWTLEFRGLREHHERLLHYLQTARPREAAMDKSPLEEWENISKETTDAFCRVFLDPGDFQGSFAISVSRGSLPQGVDPHDPRVLEIRRKCLEWVETDSETPFTD